MAEVPQPAPPTLPPGNPPNPWARTVLWLGVVLILVAGAVYCVKRVAETPERLGDKVIQGLDKVIQGAGKGGEALAKVVAAFNQGTVSNSFWSYATGISKQAFLQFATLKEMEVFTRSQAYSTAFGYLPLPKVVVEARAPVQYTYYLDLNAPWRFVLESNLVYVFTPPIRCNQPAVDVSAMTFEIREGFLNYKHSEVRDKLKGEITGLLAARARENIPLVRETVRRQAEQFVARWLAQSFTDGKEHAVKVFFPGEPASGRTQILPQPLN
jgi:hypothetical protein